MEGPRLQHEDWHWRMAVSTLFLGLVGVASVVPLVSPGSNADPAAALPVAVVGAALVGAVAYVAWATRFWSRVRGLPQPQKSIVWAAAVLGFTLLAAFWVLAIMLWNRFNDD